jgi:hypothetical protein
MKIILFLVILIFSLLFSLSSFETFINPPSYSISYPSSYVFPTDESSTLKSSCRNGYDLGLDKQCYKCPPETTIHQGPHTFSGYYCLGKDKIALQPLNQRRI